MKNNFLRKWATFTVLGLSGCCMTLLYANCSSPSGDSGTVSAVNTSQPNVMAVTVGCGYVNEPCVTVTICVPGTSTCQTIPDVLLDTGSYGLRLFNNVTLDNFNTTSPLISLPMIAQPGNSAKVLNECVKYADGSSDWGPVAKADITLGGETASSVPMQIINASFATVPAGCGTPDSSPMSTGFNGILGVGLVAADCGSECATDVANEIYYACPSSGSGACVESLAPVSLQTTNPVSFLPVDNNGVILELPQVFAQFGLNDGAQSANGYLVLGIGTQSNNIPPSGVTTFPTDGYLNFSTTFNGQTSTSSFIDSGSNALYFTAPNSVSNCTGNDSPFYCPTSELNYTATQTGNGGVGSNTVYFSLGNADDELSQSNPNVVFSDLGGTFGTNSDFDWGLPFFFGRNVYVGIDGGSSSLGTGPLWAY